MSNDGNRTVRSRFLKLAGPFLFYSGIYEWLRKRNSKGKGVILTYHRISDYGSEKNNTVFHSKFEIGITKKLFEIQMKYIRNKMCPISLQEMVSLIYKGKKIPDHAVAITFDDGYHDVYENAFPILKKFQIPATIFILPQNIGNTNLLWWDKLAEILRKTQKRSLELRSIQSRIESHSDSNRSFGLKSNQEKSVAMSFLNEWFMNMPQEKVALGMELLQEELGVEEVDIEKAHIMLTWEQVTEMSEWGISMEAHTLSHPDVTKMESIKLQKELEESKRTVEDRTNRKVFGFAYPYGFYNERTIEILKETGFEYAVTGDIGVVTRESNPYCLNRINVPQRLFPLYIHALKK